MKTLTFMMALLQCLVTTIALGSQTKVCEIEHYEDCFSTSTRDFRYPSQAFRLSHPEGSAKIAVLVHGLTDSPYAFKDIAPVLYHQGYDVHAILLDGHGTKAEDMHHVRLKTWKRQVQEAVQDAQVSHSQVLLGGFSTGGALSFDYASKNPSVISGVLLFSPAFQIAFPLAGLSCAMRPVARFAGDSDEIENAPWRYNRMPTNGVCQLYRLTRQIRGRAKNFTTPTFIAYSEHDQTVSVKAMQKFALMIASKNSKNVAVVYSKLLEPVAHAAVPFRDNEFNHQNNPEFQHLETSLIDFIQGL